MIMDDILEHSWNDNCQAKAVVHGEKPVPVQIRPPLQLKSENYLPETWDLSRRSNYEENYKF
jgi:hypothetical protein